MARSLINNPKISVVQINVTDMDEALGFYVKTIGFRIKSKKLYPNIVRLYANDFYLLLYRVDKKVEIDYPKSCQTMINIETENLERTLRLAQQKTINLIHKTPQPCPAGVFAAFRDPFGNVLEFIQFDRD